MPTESLPLSTYDRFGNVRGAWDGSSLRQMNPGIHPEHIWCRVWEPCWQPDEQVSKLMVKSLGQREVLEDQDGVAGFLDNLELELLLGKPPEILLVKHRLLAPRVEILWNAEEVHPVLERDELIVSDLAVVASGDL
jgi:hypothetical protein